MNLRKVLRLAEVLLASQLRAGRAASNPRSFFGRPVVIAAADAAAFAVVFLLSSLAAVAFESTGPGALSALLAAVLPFVPLLSVGAVLVGGLMFELASTAKFAASDAANWLPLTSAEYVVASALSLTALYSLSIAVLGGVALGLGLVGHALPAAAFAVALGAVGLLEGSLLIEILRAVTQRAGSLGRRRGSTALVVRAVAFLLVVVAFELLFNPVILLAAVAAFSGLGPVGLAIPFLWSADAVSALLAGNGLGAGVAVLGQAALLAVIGYAAARARARFWVPSGGEIEFEPHRYGSAPSALGALGFSRPELALAAKDLRSLLRRRELLPLLLLPLIVSIVLLVERGAGATPSGDSLTLGLMAWFGGLSALLLSASSFGQERKAVAHLYFLPIRPRAVLRAKASVSLLVSFAITTGILAVACVVLRPPVLTLPGLALTAALAIAEGTVIGLLAATRYSDFQDRPRPQFVRPLPMLATVGLYAVLGGVTVTLARSLSFGALSPLLPLPVAIGAVGVLVAVLAGLAVLVDGGARRLLRELPT
ncbi:MAG: hypothetical protein L3K18_01260 [Thermoplasmata archaeon]|nr:hypothetical protein [Thermoplasmata archaeon]